MRYTMNITGGMNLMAAAACSTAFFMDAVIYCVMYDREKEEMGEPQDPMEDGVVHIPTPKIPNVNGLGPKTREILEYILDEDGPDLTSVKVAEDSEILIKQDNRIPTSVISIGTPISR